MNMEITVVEQDNTILLNQHSTIPLLTMCVEGLWICLMTFMISPESHGSRGKLWKLLILKAYFRKVEEVCYVHGQHLRDQHTNINLFTAVNKLTYHTFSPFIRAIYEHTWLISGILRYYHLIYSKCLVGKQQFSTLWKTSL